MKPIVLMILVAAGAASQTSTPKAPTTVTPEDAPLPSKSTAKSRTIGSELEGVNSTEDGVMSLAKYEGGSWALKPNKVTAYVNEKEIVVVQSKQRFAIPVKAVTEVSYGNAVHSRVGQATGITGLAAGTKNQSASNPTVVGIEWTAATGKSGIVLRVDKGDFSGCMQALETVTGLKAIDADVKTR
jgi:hypothetical protein